MSPDFLAIGHIARDLLPDGYRLGGAVVYGATTALKLGLRPAIVTSAGPDLDIESSLMGIPVHAVPSAQTSTFRNTYRGGKRGQVLKGVAGPITPSDVPPRWRSAPLVLLGPLVAEVGRDLAEYFPDSLVMASIQGWLRRWDPRGRVTPAYWEGREVLPYVDAAVVSVDDVEDPRLIDIWAEITPTLIVTMGGDGARMHSKGVWHRIAPFPVEEIDPTGAGDVFAAAYLVRYQETTDPVESARFASCAASFCVEAEGVEGIPTRPQIEQRLKG